MEAALSNYATKLTPLVGAGAVVVNAAGQVLLLRRISQAGLGDDEWAFPGGHVDRGELSASAAKRELLEEVGLVALAARHLCTCENIVQTRSGPIHYVTLMYIVVGWTGEPEILEQDKFSDMGWFDPSTPPTPITAVCSYVCDHIVKNRL